MNTRKASNRFVILLVATAAMWAAGCGGGGGGSRGTVAVSPSDAGTSEPGGVMGYVYAATTAARSVGSGTQIEMFVSDVIPDGYSPVSGVSVSNGTISGTSETDGYFSLSGLSSGTNTVTFTKIGYTTKTISVPVAMNESVFAISDGSATSTATTGSIYVSSTPSSAYIYLGGRSTGFKTPRTFRNSRAGSHNVYVTLAGYVTPAVQAVAVASGKTTSVSFTLTQNGGTVNPPPPDQPATSTMNMAQTLSDGAQSTTLAFDGLAIMTGNLDAQSFFPPGKVADYTGFQYLRDNDPDNMGHNTSFLTRVANNVIYILDDNQLAQLKALAVAQQDEVNLYGYKRYPLMQAFRRLIDGDIPAGSTGLNLDAVKAASHALYLIDGQISFERALLYANIFKSMSAAQTAYLVAMKGKGWSSWPDITNAQINGKMSGLPQGTAVAVMTYASDLFSWYAGSLAADVYFCPERHGTYYGGFYIKDAPAVGHEGYSISEQLTATAGAALSDSSKGYVTQNQATVMTGLVATQKNNLNSIVSIRTQIATLLRSLLTSTASSDSVKAQVLALSGTYGDLDGENNYNYATVFAQIYKTLTDSQKTKLAALRKSIMSGTYSDGTAFDYSVATTPFLYSEVITNASLLTPYIGNTDYLFFEP